MVCLCKPEAPRPLSCTNIVDFSLSTSFTCTHTHTHTTCVSIALSSIALSDQLSQALKKPVAVIMTYDSKSEERTQRADV